MSERSLREILLARRSEIDAALRELDRIEAIAGVASDAKSSNGKSHNQAVIEAVSEGPKSIEELANMLALTEAQVYHALTSHRLRHVVKQVRIGGVKKYAMRAWDPTKPASEAVAAVSLTDAILTLLAENSGKPMRTSEVSGALTDKVPSTAVNFHGTVASTLSTLVKAGKVKRLPTRGYILREPSIFD